MPIVTFPLRFPLRLGGPEDEHAVEHQAILGALERGLSVDPNSGVWCETYADATAAEFVWACNRRLSCQADPLRMTDALTDWEQACGLVPTISDSDMARRKRLAAKMRGLTGNDIAAIEEACQALLGVAFVDLFTTPDADEVTYWPGVNPGPPGREWSSNRARIAVQAAAVGMSEESFTNALGALADMLDGIIPAWMIFDIDRYGTLI